MKTNMNLNDIFNDPTIKLLEYKILHIETLDRRRKANGTNYPAKNEIIKELLDVRKAILDKNFSSDGHNQKLIKEFNQTLINLKQRISNEVHKMLNASIKVGSIGDLRVYSYSYFSHTYPKARPVQTVRAKKIWEILTGEGGCNGNYIAGIDFYDDLIAFYPSTEDFQGGTLTFHSVDEHKEIAGVEVCREFYELYEDSSFSLYDLLWIRSFNVELYVDENYSNYKIDYDDIDLPDWIDI